MSNVTLPDEAFYPITRLQQFPKLTRETDPNAERFDPSRPIKLWRDPDAIQIPAETITYTTWNVARRRFEQFKISTVEAARLNIPGEPVYEPWVIEPTPAVMLGPDGEVSSQISPNMLCTQGQAQLLAGEIGGKLIETPWESSMFAIDWRGETRRHFTIKTGSSSANAGLLLADRWKKGINYPGHWEFTGILGSPQFVPDPIPSTAGASETPMPYRALVEGKEAIYNGSPIGTAIVYRLDMTSPYNPAAGGGADQTALLTLQEDVSEIKRLLSNMSIALGLGG